MVPPSSDTWFTFFFIFVHFPLIKCSSWSVRKITTSNSEENMTMFFFVAVFFCKCIFKCQLWGKWLVKYILCWCFGQLDRLTNIPAIDYSGRIIWGFSVAAFFTSHHPHHPHPHVPHHPQGPHHPHPHPQCQRGRQIAHRCLLTTDSVQQEVRFIAGKSGNWVFIPNPSQNSAPRVAQVFASNSFPFEIS